MGLSRLPGGDNNETRLIGFQRFAFHLKNGVSEYFKNPIRYLFYGMLLITIIGLFFKMNFSWQYYAILAIIFLGERERLNQKVAGSLAALAGAVLLIK